MIARRGHSRSLAFGSCCAVAAVLAACAPATSGSAGAGTDAAAPVAGSGAGAAQSDSLVPVGHGTLRQDDITVSLRSGAVLVKVTPLDEAIIRLVAPDTYDRLRSLRESRREEVERTTMGGTEMFLVSFFSYEPDVSFQPEDMQIVYQSRLLRPNVVVPLTTGWGRQRLDQQETQTAIYGFEVDIDYGQVMTVRYGMQETDQWRQIMVLLENERGRIRSRSGD